MTLAKLPPIATWAILAALFTGCVTTEGTTYTDCAEAVAPPAARSMRDLVVVQSCTASGALVRHPAAPGLGRIRGALVDWADDLGIPVQSWAYDVNDLIVPGTQPLPPLSDDDLRDVHTYVLRLSIGRPDAAKRIAFVTNIEGLEDAPRSNSSKPAPGADLSASGAAVLLTALADLRDAAKDWNHGVDVFVYTGELNFRGWTGLSTKPWAREVGPAYFEPYQYAFGVQNVGSCGRTFEQPLSTSRWDWTHQFIANVSPWFSAAGFELPDRYLLAEFETVMDYGWQQHPVVDWSRQVPTIQIANGWWAHKTRAGTSEDTPANICWDKLLDLVPLVKKLMSEPLDIDFPATPTRGNGPGTGGDSGGKFLTTTGNHSGVVRKIFAEVDYDEGDGNCVAFSADHVRRVPSGYVEASWTSTNPADVDLSLWYRSGSTNNGRSVSGPSPLMLELSDIAVEDELTLFLRPPGNPGAMWDVPVELTWTFTYEGSPVTVHDIVTCA